jgi:2-polyprenyl-3-methyl-5-hydroxy-6-metoxy-1,4-benzoquinol methylase
MDLWEDAMNAEQYLSAHWGPHQVWTHLKNKKHQVRLRRCAELTAGETICDVGCAYGHSTEIMAGFRPGLWAGLEFFLPAVGKARELFPKRDWLYASAIEGLIEYYGKFDSVVCSEVMEHVANDGLLINLVVGMARKRAVFTTPTIKVKDPGHLRVYTEASLRELFKGHKFEILTEHPFFFIVVDHA